MNGDSRAVNPGLKGGFEDLANLYSAVVALGLFAAVSQVVDAKGEGLPVRVATLPLLGVFLVTLVPFCHRSLRHLHSANGEGTRPNTRRGALLAGVGIVFFEACLFLAMAALLTNARYFAWTFVSLLGLDAVRGLLARVTFSRGTDSRSEGVWAWISFSATVLTAFFLLVSPNLAVPEKIVGWCLFLIAMSRTVLDYGMCWKTYFPTVGVSLSDVRLEQIDIQAQPQPAPIAPENYPLQIPAPTPIQAHARRERRPGSA